MFADRIQAGRLLADKLTEDLTGVASNNILVLSIPRGGVVIGSELAKKLVCPHDIIVTKKLRAPDQEELAIGAVGETKGSLYLNKKLAERVGVDDDYLAQEIKNRQKEIKRREKIYRGNKKELSLERKTVIIVDDGAATGATMMAAAREIWNRNPRKVIIALPVCARDTLKKLEKEVDAVIVLEVPALFYAVGQFYQNFPQLSDVEVREILDNSN